MFVKQFTGLLLSLISTPLLAHSIYLDCSSLNNQIECKGSFSDGSSASDLPIEVISYEDQLITQGHTDQNASFIFKVPTEDYYILMDAGPGHVVEVDMQDVL